MGLDSVELVWDIEGALGVELPAAETAKARTVGELHGAIMRSLDIAPGTPEAAALWERLLRSSSSRPASRAIE